VYSSIRFNLEVEVSEDVLAIRSPDRSQDLVRARRGILTDADQVVLLRKAIENIIRHAVVVVDAGGGHGWLQTWPEPVKLGFEKPEEV
jgi:hypothetical protein